MYYLEGIGPLNSLIRRLENDPHPRMLCGFGGTLPHRTTFSRFFNRMKELQDDVGALFVGALNVLQTELPDLGEGVAIDSTTVRTHSNPNRKVKSDQETGWTKKNSAGAKENGKEWFFGFKMHTLADTKYGLSLEWETTSANRHDSIAFMSLMEKAFRDFQWFSPKVLTADRGYDYPEIHEYLRKRGILAIIHMRKSSASDGLCDGIFNEKGQPMCMGSIPMEFVRTDEERGHLYRCVEAGCPLMERKGVRYCDYELWVEPEENLRVIGFVARSSKEWDELYARREIIEQLFKAMKQSRRLERHCFRGKRNIELHISMCALTCVLKMLMNARAGRIDTLRWQVRKLA